MDADYVQNLRYKLQKRFRRLNSVDWQFFHYSLKQFWHYLVAQPALLGILEDIERRCTSCEADAEKIFAEKSAIVSDTELDSVGLGYFVTKKCIASTEHGIEAQIGIPYGTTKAADAVEFFRTLFVEPLYEHLDEQLDDQRALLALLRRYKHKCEWFQRHSSLVPGRPIPTGAKRR